MAVQFGVVDIRGVISLSKSREPWLHQNTAGRVYEGSTGAAGKALVFLNSMATS